MRPMRSMHTSTSEAVTDAQCDHFRSAELKAQLAERGSSAQLRVYCSPLTRTLETAVIVAEHNGMMATDSGFQACNGLSIHTDSCLHAMCSAGRITSQHRGSQASMGMLHAGGAGAPGAQFWGVRAAVGRQLRQGVGCRRPQPACGRPWGW